MPPDKTRDVSPESRGDDVSAEPDVGVDGGPDIDAGPPFDPGRLVPALLRSAGIGRLHEDGVVTAPGEPPRPNPPCIGAAGPGPWWCFLHLPPGFCAHDF